MRIVQRFPPTICALVLGAHFLRSGNILLMSGALGLLPLIFLDRPWGKTAIRLVLGLGALEWLRTLMVLRASRIETGLPHLRMTVILGLVATLTALSGWWIGPGRGDES